MEKLVLGANQREYLQMVEVTATQFELIMHSLETKVIKTFWTNYKQNNGDKVPSAEMQRFIEDNMKWTVSETFKMMMIEIFEEK